MLSPPFRPSTSPPRATSGPLPTLPPEVIRRIIHFRLALTPSYPSSPPVSRESVGDDGCDAMAGGKAKAVEICRVKERGEVMRAAKGLLTICKAWKPLVIRYLYAEPHITNNLPSLASAIQLGDSKWSDINLHAFSLPGRYITTLDLSLLSLDNPSQNIAIRRALLSIFPLLPNVTHLKLPLTRLPFLLEEIGWSAFANNLRCLEVVRADRELDGEGRDGLIELLRRLPRLEILCAYDASLFLPPTAKPSDVLCLPHLHTLSLDNVNNGRLMDALIPAKLPSLRRLLLTSFYPELDDQTFALQESHGENIWSLAYLPARSPHSAMTFIPTLQTLDLYPNLVHLFYLIPDRFDQLQEVLKTISGASAGLHRITSLTVSKVVGTEIHSTASTTTTISRNPSNLQMLFEFLSTRQTGVKRLKIDSFKWVRAELGKAAMYAGANGEMRNWANKLSKNGIELRDMDGALPPIERAMSGPGCGQGGRRRSSGVVNTGWGMIAALAEKESSPASENGREDEDGG